MIFYLPATLIPLQLPAYHSAVVRGFDPNKPRNFSEVCNGEMVRLKQTNLTGY